MINFEDYINNYLANQEECSKSLPMAISTVPGDGRNWKFINKAEEHNVATMARQNQPVELPRGRQ